MKSFLKLIGLCVLAGAVAGFFFFKSFAIDAASTTPGELIVDVPPGSTFTSLRHSLEAQGLTIPALPLRLWARATNAGRHLKSGEFRVERSWNAKRIFEEISLGTPILRKLTVREGLNAYDVQAEFAKAWPSPGGADSFAALVVDEGLMTRMQVPATLPPGARRSLEGFLFPETYSFQKYDSPKAVIESMLAQFDARALPLLKEHPWGTTPEGRWRLLTLASMVEKESGLVEEQPVIASVFWNRLGKHMRLQSDPTTIYGLLPHFDGNLKRIHLTTPSPYNTYTLAELPAGPICNPGTTAIRAVVHPAQTTSLYFVARADGTGTHVFSSTLEEHNANVRKFQLHK